MPKTYTLEQAIARLEQRERILEDPTAFFRFHLRDWRDFAKAIIRRQGRLVRPEDASEKDWQSVIDAVAARVDVYLVDPSPDAGADITLVQPRDPASSFHRIPITMAHIMQWVEAGERGEELGKNLDGRDETASGQPLPTEQIAANVWFALKSRSMRGLAIREFLAQDQVPQLDDLMLAVLAGWELELIPRIRRQWQGWIADVAALRE